MGKDRDGKFHPRKGKPSGGKNDGTVGLKDVNSSAIEDYYEVAEKYTVGEEEPAPNLHVRHPNRNVDKNEERMRDRRSTNTTANASNKSRTETFTVERSNVRTEELPAQLSKEQLTDLVNFKSDCCITAYLPTSQAGPDKNDQRDSIAFKNLLQLITSQLRQKGFDQGRIESLLKPAYDLLRQDDFWLNLSNGLAVFMTEGEFRYIRLPFVPKEEILINSTFYIKPLLPAITSKDYFYVLTLNKKQVKLYRADNFGMVYIPVSELPNGVDDVVHFEEKDDQNLFRTESGGAGQGANYHGIGGGKPDEKAHLAQYFDEVDETLWKEILHTETAPLLLAGVEYLLPIYRSVAEYKYIWDDVITGSHQHDNISSLYQLAREKMQPYFNQRVNKALETYGNQSATALTSSIPADVIPAAYYGRVAHLFVEKDEHIWGSFDEMDNLLEMHETYEEGDECLIDKAIIKTLLTGGEVHVLEKQQMPGESKIASVMRYNA